MILVERNSRKRLKGNSAILCLSPVPSFITYERIQSKFISMWLFKERRAWKMTHHIGWMEYIRVHEPALSLGQKDSLAWTKPVTSMHISGSANEVCQGSLRVCEPRQQAQESFSTLVAECVLGTHGKAGWRQSPPFNMLPNLQPSVTEA